MDAVNWDNFELRNFNHDLGRWSAPDPYGQFHSPYVAMANDPVSTIDPNGGYINISPEGINQRIDFIKQLNYDRSMQIGRFSYQWLNSNYKEELEGLRFAYKEHDFLVALLDLNKKYQGMGLAVECMASGVGRVSNSCLIGDKELINELGSFNGETQKLAAMKEAANTPDAWFTATPNERKAMGIKAGIYDEFKLVSIMVSKRQLGQKDSESGENDDFITGYAFYYQSNSGNSYHTYINTFPNQNNNTQSNNNGGVDPYSVALGVGELAFQGKVYNSFGKTAQAVEKLLKSGKYLHNKEVYYKGNYRGVTKSMTKSLNAAKLVKGVGRAFGIAGLAMSAVEYINSKGTSSDKARLAGSVIISGISIIPKAGPFISIVLGIADGFGAFNEIYDYFGK